MLHSPQLRRIRNITILLLIAFGFALVAVGCAQLYKFLGLSDRQVADQVAADQTARQEIIQGIRLTTTELITTAIAGLGAIASGFLAKWLGTERKITAAMIGAVEHAANDSVKKAIKNHATASGVEPKLHARVKSLT